MGYCENRRAALELEMFQYETQANGILALLRGHGFLEAVGAVQDVMGLGSISTLTHLTAHGFQQYYEDKLENAGGDMEVGHLRKRAMDLLKEFDRVKAEYDALSPCPPPRPSPEPEGSDGTGGQGGRAGNDAATGSRNSNLVIRDPFVVDLDGDGIELVNLSESYAYFDLDGDGFATKNSWISSDDGFLVLDKNNDAIINNIYEMFGSPQRTGYEELSFLDSSNDGIIDFADEQFSSLKIWQDINGDGFSQAHELGSLINIGILNIDLDYEHVPFQANSDGQVVRRGLFTWADGHTGIAGESSGLAADVVFLSNPTFTQYVGNIDIDPEVVSLGNIKGYGQMPDLHIAMSLNADLKASVISALDGQSFSALKDDFESILIKWANVEGINVNQIDPAHVINVNPDTGLIDFPIASESFTVEQLGIVKQYAGMDVLRLNDGHWFEDNSRRTIATSGGYYRQAYEKIVRNTFVKFLVSNNLLSDVAPNISYDVASDTLSIGENFSKNLFIDQLDYIIENKDDANAVSKGWAVIAALTEINPSSIKDLSLMVDVIINNNTDLAVGNIFNNSYFKLLDLNSYFGLAGADIYHGKASDDKILGFDGDDIVNGGKGLDSIWGGDGNDVIGGGEGADKLFGGDGEDRIMAGNGDDLLLGENGNDVLDGGEGHDMLLGQSDNDQLDGKSGDDALFGGKGIDSLAGGKGDDTYYWGLNEGSDVITDIDGFDQLNFGENVEIDKLKFNRQGSAAGPDSLIITAVDTGEVLTIKHWFGGGYAYGIDKITFYNDSTLDRAAIDELSRLIKGDDGENSLYGFSTDEKFYGYAGNDRLNGKGGNDELYGGDGNDNLTGDVGADLLQGDVGNDILEGGYDNDDLYGGVGDDSLTGGQGNDIYRWGRGDGNDIINDYDYIDRGNLQHQDKLILGAGITAQDIKWSRSNIHLIATIKDTGEQLTIQNWFNSAPYKLEVVELADGTPLDLSTIEADTRTIAGTSAGESLEGFSTDDILYGLDGNDYLHGKDGNDKLYGGSGIDTLNGNSNNDELDGGDDNDTLKGDAGNDLLMGGAGNDTLEGGYDNDHLNGGIGDDFLNGEQGDDFYHWGLGQGSDTIADIYGYDKLYFDASVEVTRLKFSRQGSAAGPDSLIITALDTGETLRINSWFGGSSSIYGIDEIVFSDNSSLNRGAIDELSRAITGDDTPNSLFGFGSDDILRGLSGNDQLYGNSGNDKLYGDNDNDTLKGDAGNDLLLGGSGNDTLEGGGDNDDLYGGAGNDTLTGLQGNDIYRWGRGDGNDTINDYDVTDRNNAQHQDKLILGAGITAQDIKWSRSSLNLIATIKDTGEQLTIQNWFNGISYKLEVIELANGTALDRSTIELDTRTIIGTNAGESLQGFNNDDTLNGLDGNDFLYGNEGNDKLYGGSGIDTLNGGSNNDELDGGDDGDTLKGDTGNDLLLGGLGNDTLEGGTDNDDLYGGTGNDTLTGGQGNDIYRWGRGDGNDTINDYDNTDKNNAQHQDKLILGAGITAQDIKWSRSNLHMIATIKDTGEQLTIQNWFNGTPYKLEVIELANGSVLDRAEIELDSRTIIGTSAPDGLNGFNTDDNLYGLDGNDSLFGNEGNDKLFGDAGTDNLNGGGGNDELSGGNDNDTIKGDEGNDLLIGGSGNDTLEGGTGNDDLFGGAHNDTLTGGQGNDIYRWGRGEGNDTIIDYDNADRNNAQHQDKLILGAGITAQDIKWSRSSLHLIATIKDSGEQLTVQNWFSGASYKLEVIELADGPVLDKAAIELDSRNIVGTSAAEGLSGFDTDDTLQGLDGNDNLNANAGNDTLIGGTGNDSLNGSDGSDVYLFSLGDGIDSITNYDPSSSSNDVAHFQAASYEDLWLTKNGNNLVIAKVGSDDKVTISNWYAGASYQLDSIKTDSFTLLNAQVNQLVSAMASFSPPIGRGSVMPNDVREQILPTLTSVWQPN